VPELQEREPTVREILNALASTLGTSRSSLGAPEFPPTLPGVCAEDLGFLLTVKSEQALTTGDPGLIERLVTNLVDNAMKYNVTQGRVNVATSTKSGRAVLSVSNTGPWVPATETNRLLQPFQRLGTNRTRHDGGYGLGLSIVQAIATAHNANIATTPRPTGGLEITVTFPATPPDRLR
jgi:signal transduction histidine kinase